MIEGVRQVARALAREVPDFGPERPRVVEIGGSRGSRGRVAFFVFDGRRSHPAFVVRVARRPSAEPSLREEWTVRREFETALARTQPRGGVPRALALARVGGLLALVEEGCPGTPCRGLESGRWELWRHRRVTREIEVVSQWLTAFWTATHRDTRPWTEADEEAVVLDPMRRWMRFRGSPGASEWLLSALRRRIAPLRGVPVTWTGVHGDLWHGNVLTGARDTVVVDWESTKRTGPRFVDALTFAFQYVFWRRHPAGSPAAPRGWAPPRWTGAVMGAFVRTMLPELAADGAALEAAFVIALVTRCAATDGTDRAPASVRAVEWAVHQPEVSRWLFVR